MPINKQDILSAATKNKKTISSTNDVSPYLTNFKNSGRVGLTKKTSPEPLQSSLPSSALQSKLPSISQPKERESGLKKLFNRIKAVDDRLNESPIVQKAKKASETLRTVASAGTSKVFDALVKANQEDQEIGFGLDLYKYRNELQRGRITEEEVNQKVGLDIYQKLNDKTISRQDANDLLASRGLPTIDDREKRRNTVLMGMLDATGELKNVAKEGLEEVSKIIAKNVAKREAARDSGVGIGQKIKTFFTRTKAASVDAESPLTDLVAEVTKKGKVSMLPQYQISEQIAKVKRAPAVANQFMKDNGLTTVIRNVDDIDAFGEYLIAKRSLRLANDGITTGRNVVDDAKIVETLKDKYEPFAQRVKKYNDALLDYAVKKDLIDADVAARLKFENPDYVPFDRIFDEIEGGVVGKFSKGGTSNLSKQTFLQQIEGSERAIENPLFTYVKKTNQLIMEGEKNIGGQIIASMSRIADNPYGIKPLRTAENVLTRIETAQQLKSLGQSNRKLISEIARESKGYKGLLSKIDDINDSISSLVDEGVIKSIDGESESQVQKVLAKIYKQEEKLKAIVEKKQLKEFDLTVLNDELSVKKGLVKELREVIKNAKDVTAEKGKGTISFLRNGIKEVYEVPLEIAEAAKGMNNESLGLIAQIAALPARLIRFGSTTGNLSFASRNIPKDQVGAFVFSKYPTSTANPINFIEGLMAAVRHNELWDELVRRGAGGGSVDVSRNNPAKTLEDIRFSPETLTEIFSKPKQQLKESKGFIEKGKFLITSLPKLFRVIEDIVSVSEMATRAQQFTGTKKAVLKQGGSLEEALFQAGEAARNSTLDFFKMGSKMRTFNAIVPYFNSRIRGIAQLAHGMKTNPVGTATRLMISLQLPVAITTLYNLSDDKRKAIYDDISDFEKESNLIIIGDDAKKNPDTGRWEGVFKVPLASGLSNFSRPISRMLEMAYDVDDNKFKDFAHDILNGISPVGSDRKSFLNSVLPPVGKLAVELETNTNLFTGREITPQWMIDQGVPESEQKKAGTSGTASIIADLMNTSPIKADYIIKGTFGGLGQQVLNLTDRVLAKAGVIDDEEIGGESITQNLRRTLLEAYGGQPDEKTIAELDSLIANQQGEKWKTHLVAEGVYQELSTLPKEAAKKKLNELKASNEVLFKEVVDVWKDANANLTLADRKLKQLNIENGERAKYIATLLNTLPNNDMKKVKLKELQSKGLLSDKVLEQVAYLLKKKEQ